MDPVGDPPHTTSRHHATRGVADGNVVHVDKPAARHANVAKRMPIEVSVVRDLAALRGIESPWRELASTGAGALFRGPDWLIPWWGAYHNTLAAELHVLVGR